MSWTLKPTGGDLVERSPLCSGVLLPCLSHVNELAQLRIHLKRCLRSKAAQSLMRLGDFKDISTNDTSLTKGWIVCVAPAQVLESETVCIVPAHVLTSEELSDHEKRSHLRKVENGVPCVVG